MTFVLCAISFMAGVILTSMIAILAVVMSDD